MNFIKRMQTSCHYKLKSKKTLPFFYKNEQSKILLGITLTIFSLFPFFPLSSYANPLAYSKPPTEDFDHLQQKLHQLYLKKAHQQGMRSVTIHIKKNSSFDKLPKCQTSIQFEDRLLRRQSRLVGRHTIKVSCPTPKWKTYISLNISGTVPAIVSTQGIMKNITITPNMVKQVWQDAQKARQQRLVSLKTVIGMRAKRPIPPNKVLTIKDIVPPYLVTKHNEVTIETRIGTITIRTKGIAEKDGIQGEQIPVKNKKSGKVIKAIVTGRDLVEVP